MKSRLLFAVLLTVAVMMIASVAFAASPAEQVATPFKGTIQAAETNVVQFPTLYVDATGSGNATHLGRYTVSYQAVVYIPTLAGVDAAHFIAANGDSIFAEGLGQASDSGIPNVFKIVEKYTITGGTGRFDGATGSFIVERLLNTTANVTSGSFDGSIVLPRGK